MKYLKDRQEYIDRYDLFTIKECLSEIDFLRETYKKHLADKNVEKFSAGDKAKGFNWVTNQVLFHIKADRYRKKEEIIQQWMSEDQQKQEKYDTTPQPRNILCRDCTKIMKNTLKQLEIFDGPLRMMFLFICPSCKKKRWIYEDGSEYKISPHLCPKCRSEAQMSLVKEEKDKVTWKTTCSSCGFTEITVDEFEKERDAWKKKEEEERALLEEYRVTFCSDEDGKKSFEYVESLKVAELVYHEEFKKYDSLAYQKASSLKKLSIPELERLLSEPIGKANYSKFSFDKPEIGIRVIVSFSAQDADLTRKADTSISGIQKLIKSLLEGTNWRLMSDGVSYRLGYLSGRLKGYEREEELFELSGEKKEEESSKIDYETRMRYEGHNAVQFARFMGQAKGLQSSRKRRLERDPEGYFLEANDDFYQCGICGRSTPSEKAWWNLDGVRCADCQRNIKEGVIPSEIHEQTDIWIKGWELTSEYEFDIPAGRVKKLVRDGLLHGRELKREDGTTYFTVYLVAENQEFLKKYPRKPKNKMFITDLLGNTVEL